MSQSDTCTTLTLRRPGGNISAQTDNVLPEPDPGDRVRSVVTENSAVSEQHAVHLRDSAASIFMFASTGAVLAGLDVAGYRLYRDQLLADYGDPKDPVAVMLIEQLALAHLNTGQLFYRAASASSVECAQAYLAAATRLMAEFRRTALALPGYREAVQRLERGADLAESGQENPDGDSELQGVEDSDESSSPLRLQGPSGQSMRVARTPRKAASGDAG